MPLGKKYNMLQRLKTLYISKKIKSSYLVQNLLQFWRIKWWHHMWKGLQSTELSPSSLCFFLYCYKMLKFCLFIHFSRFSLDELIWHQTMKEILIQETHFVSEEMFYFSSGSKKFLCWRNQDSGKLAINKGPETWGRKI